MNKKRLKIVGCSIIIIGLIVCIFPFVLRYFSTKNMLNKIENFVEEVSELNNTDQDESQVGSDSTESQENMLDFLYEKFKTYNESLYTDGQELVDAFSYEEASFDLTEYGFSENIIAYIDIPKMNVTLPIYLGATKENLKNGATLLSQTSIPIGGENTNAVIAAHRGTFYGIMFRNIQKLELGDTITITNMWDELTYEVCEIRVIDPEDINQILIQEGRDLITLITCHPYRVDTQRYVVFAERCL